MACKRSGVQIPSAPLPLKPQVNRPAVVRSPAAASVAFCAVRPLPAAHRRCGRRRGTCARPHRGPSGRRHHSSLRDRTRLPGPGPIRHAGHLRSGSTLPALARPAHREGREVCLWLPQTAPNDFNLEDGLRRHLDRVREFLILQLMYEDRKRRGIEPAWPGPIWDRRSAGHEQWLREQLATTPAPLMSRSKRIGRGYGPPGWNRSSPPRVEAEGHRIAGVES
jgi:hypothetical protein